MIPRKLKSKLLEMAGKFPVIAVTGPRQSGKTTLCTLAFNDYSYVTLEDIDQRQFAQQDPRAFLAQQGERIIIDEAQLVPELFSYIQGIVDREKKMGQFVLTGSQNFSLIERMSQSLAGRVYITQLLPLSYQERSETDPQSLDEAIFKGGYPAIYDRDIAPADYFPSYVQTYLERDVRLILNVSDLNTFGTFLKLCAGRVGQLFNASQIANDAGIDHKTVQQWLTVLEASFVVYRLHPWHRNFRKRLVKSPKIYFYDTGLLSYLLNITEASQYQLHFAKGALFENYVITELIKSRWNQGIRPQPYFWRDHRGNEVDLLFERGTSTDIIELKSARTFHPDFAKGLDYLEKISGGEAFEKWVVYGGSSPQNRSDFQVKPWNDLGDLAAD